jgi:HlyD family secretion protein
VIADEALIHLDDEEARARITTSLAQVEMRERARNDQGAGKGAERRRAEDAVADAETAVVQAKESFDAAVKAKHDGSGSDADIASTRATWRMVKDRLSQRLTQLHKLEDEPNTPLPAANEGQLNIARGELRTAYAGLEQLTIRAPVASTVLQVNTAAGELASPSAPQALVLLGDLSGCDSSATIAPSGMIPSRTGHGPRPRSSDPEQLERTEVKVCRPRQRRDPTQPLDHGGADALLRQKHRGR